MQKYAKINNNIVDNIRFSPKEGYVKVPDNVFARMIQQEDGTFLSSAPVALTETESKNIFRQNRATIMNSIGWIHERIQSQTVLIQGGKTLTASYTTAQAIEYYDYKQALRDRPSIITDWTSISYPVVPQHVYDDMTDSIKALCQELQCDPVV